MDKCTIFCKEKNERNKLAKVKIDMVVFVSVVNSKKVGSCKSWCLEKAVSFAWFKHEASRHLIIAC